MKIEAIRLKDFKAFKDAEMRDIPRMCVVGAVQEFRLNCTVLE